MHSCVVILSQLNSLMSTVISVKQQRGYTYLLTHQEDLHKYNNPHKPKCLIWWSQLSQSCQSLQLGRDWLRAVMQRDSPSHSAPLLSLVLSHRQALWEISGSEKVWGVVGGECIRGGMTCATAINTSSFCWVTLWEFFLSLILFSHIHHVF